MKQEDLSQEWIDENKVARINDVRKMTTSDVVTVEKLQNLLVPKQELPVIPKYVADWFEENKEHFEGRLKSAIKYRQINDDPSEFDAWLDNPHNKPLQTLGNMFNGYEVEEESLYYALIKGHELVADEGDWGCNYWNLNIPDGRVFPSHRLPRPGVYITEMSKAEWNKLGINDSNADFVKVDE